MKNSKIREDLTKKFVAALNEGEFPWNCGWEKVSLTYNAVSQSRYRGVNQMILAYESYVRGWEDPRFCTFKQAVDAGWHVKSGEHGTRIEFWSNYDAKEKKKLTFRQLDELKDQLTPEEFRERVKVIAQTSVVFNAAQIEGIPELEFPERIGFDADLCEKHRTKLLDNMGVGFYEGGDRAYYSPSSDKITLPEINQFKDMYAYMSTLLHEAGHASGHPSRLNRNLSG